MKSLPKLKEQARQLQQEIEKLLIDNYRFDEDLSNRVKTIETVSSLEEQLANIHREIRELQAP